ncbi:MAG: hypothetical protein M1491_00395 [Deltaproteobacteria bacterium]|nr:hypothetical protein [Deltaproteobacteria bacterium]
MIRLLGPSLLALRRTLSLSNRRDRLKLAGIALMAIGLFAGEYIFFVRILVYFSNTELIGRLLIEKMLSMADFIFFAMLVFSNIVTSISTYYLSDDIALMLSAPITLEQFFYARLAQTVIKSSWMVLLFGMPIYIAYGTVLGGGIAYYAIMLAGILAFIFTASAAGTILTIVSAYLLPARRFRELMLFLSLVLFIAVYIGFRVMRPERFLNPQRFENVMGYLAALRSSQSPLLPSTWLSSSLMSAIYRAYAPSLAALFPLASTALGLVSAGVLVTYLFYRTGFTKAQESKSARFGGKGMVHRVMNALKREETLFANAIVRKDILCFFRDTSQWSQLLLIGALILVYVYNFTALPLREIPLPTVYLKNAVAFFNLWLAAFVITAISARFAFPAVSLEGRAMWLIKVSPNDLAELIRAKIAYNLLPLALIAAALVFFTNRVLGVFPYIMWLSVFTILLLTGAITNLGVSLGTIYPKYRYENVAEIAMGFGGFVFMITSLVATGTVLIIQAVPTYTVMKAFAFGSGLTLYDYVWIILLYLLSVSVIVYPVLYIRDRALNAIKLAEG